VLLQNAFKEPAHAYVLTINSSKPVCFKACLFQSHPFWLMHTSEWIATLRRTSEADLCCFIPAARLLYTNTSWRLSNEVSQLQWPFSNGGWQQGSKLHLSDAFASHEPGSQLHMSYPVYSFRCGSKQQKFDRCQLESKRHWSWMLLAGIRIIAASVLRYR